MSNLSNDIQQSANSARAKMDICVREATEEKNPDDLLNETYPHFTAFQSYGTHESVRGVRRLVRHFGGVSWDSSADAVEATLPVAANAFIPLLVRSLAFGVLMGRKPSSVIRKYEVMEKIDELFTSERFQVEAGLEALKITGDADAMAGIQRFFRNSVYLTGSRSGFGLNGEVMMATMEISNLGESRSQNLSGFGNPAKVFELYLMCLSTIIPLLYAAGVELGRKWEEEETLAGIMSASEEQS